MYKKSPFFVLFFILYYFPSIPILSSSISVNNQIGITDYVSDEFFTEGFNSAKEVSSILYIGYGISFYLNQDTKTCLTVV